MIDNLVNLVYFFVDAAFILQNSLILLSMQEISEFVVDATFEIQLTFLYTLKLGLFYKIVDATGYQWNPTIG